MTFPKQTLTVVDPGLGVVQPVANQPMISGKSFGGTGTANTLLNIGSLNDVRTILGFGPLAEDVALALQRRGGPIYAVIHSDSTTPLTAVALTASGTTPPAVTVSGLPRNRYNVRVEILTAGALGVATFRYTLDAWDLNVSPYTWSQTRIVPAGGTFVVPNSGLTLNFPAGTYNANNVYTYTALPPEVQSADLATVGTLINNTPSVVIYQWLVSGVVATAAAGATLAAAFGGYLAALTATFRFARGYVDVGSGDTSSNVATQAANWTDARISPAYGLEYITSALPFEGYSVRRASCVSSIAVRGFGSLISTDLSRTASGPAEGVLGISFDANYDQSLDTLKIGGMRTFPGMPGFYIANAPLKSPFGSDYTDAQFGRIMDVACRVTYEAQFPFLSEAFRTVSDPVGAIDPKDATAIETSVTAALNNALLTPANARGIPGHVSALSYTVDRNQNIVLTGQLKTAVGIRPLGYSKQFLTTLFFTLNP